ADRNRSHWSTSKTPSYTKSVSWQHHQDYIYRCFGRSNSESDQIKRTFVNIYTKSAWDILKEYP
ncbi:hypothetical protein, partial [Escherichia coli]|uniref:hypothetical protein n=1 Tax=Escherichia coli TaxID=562 RepID=UPI001FF2B847